MRAALSSQPGPRHRGPDRALQIATVRSVAEERHTEGRDALAELRALPQPPDTGWPVAGGGRVAHLGHTTLYQATTTQIAGLFPFVAGSGTRTPGVPIGRDLHTAEPIGLHPGQWLTSGLTTNLGIYCQAQPGVGKSAFAKRLGVGMVAFGWQLLVPGDVKGEYTDLIHRLGGTVISVGRGRHAVNPLDPGPLRSLLASSGSDAERTALREMLRARQAALLEGLLMLEMGREPTTTERALLTAALDVASDHAPDAEPTIPDVLRVLDQAPEPLLRAARVEHATNPRERYFELQRGVLSTLDLLTVGPLRGLFDRRSTVRPDPDGYALSLDISGLDEEADAVVAAALLCSWSWGAGLIEARQRGTGRNLLWIQDEMWRAMRAGPGLVERTDRMTRLGRHKGVAHLYCNHSMLDSESLPTEADRAKARGIAARCAIHVYGGLPASEVDLLTASLTSREQEMIASWQAAGTWIAGQDHPGRGLYLIKAGARVGLPVRMQLTAAERDLYDTDRALRAPRTHEGGGGERA